MGRNLEALPERQSVWQAFCSVLYHPIHQCKCASSYGWQSGLTALWSPLYSFLLADLRFLRHIQTSSLICSSSCSLTCPLHMKQQSPIREACCCHSTNWFGLIITSGIRLVLKGVTRVCPSHFESSLLIKNVQTLRVTSRTCSMTILLLTQIIRFSTWDLH